MSLGIGCEVLRLVNRFRPTGTCSQVCWAHQRRTLENFVVRDGEAERVCHHLSDFSEQAVFLVALSPHSGTSVPG